MEVPALWLRSGCPIKASETVFLPLQVALTLLHHDLGQSVSSRVPCIELSLSSAAWEPAAFLKMPACTRSEQEQHSNKSTQTAGQVFEGAGARGPIHIPCAPPVVTRQQPGAGLWQVIYIASHLSLAWHMPYVCRHQEIREQLPCKGYRWYLQPCLLGKFY